MGFAKNAPNEGIAPANVGILFAIKFGNFLRPNHQSSFLANCSDNLDCESIVVAGKTVVQKLGSE